MPFVMASAAFCAECEHSARLTGVQKSLPVFVDPQRAVFVIVQPCTPQLFFLQRKPKRLNQMQRAANVTGEANDIAGVGWYFRLEQHDAEHKNLLKQ
jgi:hypothetical protein